MSTRLANLPETLIRLESLIAATAGRDEAAFSELCQLIASRLFTIAIVILKRHDAAQDVVQEAYLRIWLHAGSFSPQRGSPLAWMDRIVRNLAIDIYLKGRRQPKQVDIDQFEVAAQNPSPLDESADRDECRRAVATLSALDPQKRQLVISAYMQGESRERIALRMGVPVNTVKTRLRRALAQLRTEFDGSERVRQTA
jgi:RNA polymerase sigma-70 factor, ECF subfamily